MDLRAPSLSSGLPQRRLNVSNIDKWVLATPPGTDAVIDLSHVEFIDTAGLAVVAAIAEDAASQRLPVQFLTPTNSSVCRYLARMHVDKCLSQFRIDVKLPTVNERDAGGRLFELQRFDADNGDELAESVFRAVESKGGSQAAAKNFFQGVSEVVSNVIDHSGVEGGWAAMQVMPNEQGVITFAIADAGYGIEATLSRVYEVDGPLDAMRKAFDRTISGTGVHGRGTGLDDLLQRVKRHKGHLRAWSGAASGRSSGGPLACLGTTAAFPGTVVYAGFTPEPRKVPM